MNKGFRIISILLVVITLSGCLKRYRFIGTWEYRHVSSVNGGTTETTMYFNKDKTCSYDMKYTLLGRTIVDTTSYCTWKVEDKYIVIDTSGQISYFYYDKENDYLYSLDKTTKTKDWKYTRG